jgi:hypothetical protein
LDPQSLAQGSGFEEMGFMMSHFGKVIIEGGESITANER